jgi:steroid delta-isomerase-like uncharacterized protein
MGELQDLVEGFYAAFSAGDLDTAMSYAADDVVSKDPSGEKHGAAAWRAYGEMFRAAAPDAKLTLRNAIEQGDTIFVEGAFTGTFTGPMQTPQGEAPPTGNAFEVPFVDVFVFRDGKFAEQRVYYDQMGMLAQMGLLPEGAPAA